MSLNKERIKEIFSQVVKDYEKYAIVDQTTAEYLLEILSMTKLEPQVILDLGCATGHSTTLLAKRYPNAKIIGVDFSEAMLEAAKNNCQGYSNINFQLMDVERLSFDMQSVDIVFANMLLPYCNALAELFFRIHCVLKSEGLFVFSTLGPNTLFEFQNLPDEGVKINGLIDMHDVGDLLSQSQLLDPVAEMEALVLRYSSIDKMKNELNGMGIKAILGQAQENFFDRAIGDYEEHFKQDNKFHVTFETVYGHAWGSKHTNVTHQTANGEHAMDVGLLKGQRPI